MSQADIFANLRVPDLSIFHAGLALGTNRTAEVKVNARVAADWLHPVTPNWAQSST